MRAIVLSGFGGLESLVIKELPDPKPKALHVLIAVKAFGVNQAETHMRKGDWAEAGPHLRNQPISFNHRCCATWLLLNP
jgi:NADPH:quinone reductase